MGYFQTRKSPIRELHDPQTGDLLATNDGGRSALFEGDGGPLSLNKIYAPYPILGIPAPYGFWPYP